MLQDEERLRKGQIPEMLEFLPVAGALHPHPAVRATAWVMGLMRAMGGLYAATDKGEKAPNQPDDFGNYYGVGGMNNEAKAN
ncbi:hypothetical protein [Anaeroselena agilis]|uniref:Uncharacterized protein n=1 Tax=Anaeroselena agilis TaxID=3063788 RepID=A0ABU3NVL0_9FIRM|nr:hypothetical protein [Selenomonadales bacterium 4137-cl]